MPLLDIVLHEPEIPNNTGNIGRTCVALGCALHLVGPLGFDTSEKACRRAGLDYWARLSPSFHLDMQSYLETRQSGRVWLFTTKASRYAGGVEFAPGDALIFGKETRGLPDDILARHADSLVTLPMVAGERSLNLATAVCAGAYLAIDQFVRRGLMRVTADGRLENVSDEARQ